MAGAARLADGYCAFGGSVLVDDGRVVSWGYAPHGHGHDGCVREPAVVEACGAVRAVSHGMYLYVAVRDDGTVVAGSRDGSILKRADGHGELRPVPV